MVATSYLLGVSTRRVEKLVEQLGVAALSKSQVSEMAAHLDAQVEAFRNRPLDGGPYTLRGRKAQLEIDLEQSPQMLTPTDQTKIRDRIRGILTNGVPNARKAMCEAMIKEIVIIADDAVRPIFKLPIAGNDEGLALAGPALSDSEHAVRALTTMVGDTGIEPVTSSV